MERVPGKKRHKAANKGITYLVYTGEDPAHAQAAIAHRRLRHSPSNRSRASP